MNIYVLGIITALAGMPAWSQSNSVPQAVSQTASAPSTNDPVELQYKKILADDDAAQEEIQKWVRDADAFREKGITAPRTPLRNRLRQRLEPVEKEYRDFVQQHPEHARARLAFGSFLNDSGDEDGAVEQWEKARELDPKNPAAWNNLGMVYGEHRGPVVKAFEYLEKAIELKPDEPVYYQNLADHVYVYRPDATNYYHITETEVFDKALDLYRKAMKLDPGNFLLATEYAQSFYGTIPPRLKEGLAAWEQALKLASTEVQREGVLVHLTRIKIALGRLDEARQNLNAVTNESYTGIKATLNRNLTNAVAKLAATNSPAPPAK